MQHDDTGLEDLLSNEPAVINVGLEAFAGDLVSQGIRAIQVDWAPPATRDLELGRLLAELEDGARSDAMSKTIESANARALDRMLRADPVLVDVVPAADAIASLGEGVILHAGPPIEWRDMCGPMRGAVAGIAVFEGWASDLEQASAMAANAEFEFRPNHGCGAVGPMTGMTTRSQPVMVVENTTFGNRAYCTVNEGLGKVMRFGGNDAEVLDRLRWLRDVLGPALGAALRATQGVALKPLVARGLTMGDEMHQRNVACSSLLLRELAPSLASTAENVGSLAEILAFIGANDQFFLNVAMAMGKAITDPASGIEGSSIVTAMSRNGTEFGIRVSGTGERWFTAPVEMPQGLYFPGFTEADANPDMGDSTIVETVGLGGFAMAAAPAVAGFVGAGAASEAVGFTRTMSEITAGENPEWTIPALDYAGVPTGIDVRLVVRTGVVPTINTGIAHREPGVGQVGAGVVRAPMKCFETALRAFAAQRGRVVSEVAMNRVRPGFYLDSVALMRISVALTDLDGVHEAALMMGTPANRAILESAGLLVADGRTAAPGDLVIAVRAKSEEAASRAIAEAARRLDRPKARSREEAWRPRTIRGAAKAMSGANLALVSVAGEFAVAEARAALRNGLHCMLFSSNVSVADERALKEQGRASGRLVMGPDCGTAIIAGAPLAFANAVPRGDIGVVGASGTGIQEVTCLVALGGGGISHAIGVGGRDLSDAVSGISTLMAIDAFDADERTRHVVVVSKPPGPGVVESVMQRIAKSAKTFTICFLGAPDFDVPGNARQVGTLKEAALDALGGDPGTGIPQSWACEAKAAEGRGRIVGLYCGGTLCAETQVLFKAAGEPVASNAAIPGVTPLGTDPGAHSIVDLGDEEYTQGKPHPMIDPSVRNEMLRQTLSDEAVAVILLDLVIGYGAHADPAGAVAAVLADAARERPIVLASVTGTESDPQRRSDQVAKLEAVGAIVAPSNADAALAALNCIKS